MPKLFFQMKITFMMIVFLNQLSLILSQPVPYDNLLYQSRKLLLDAGLHWETLSNLGSVRFQTKEKLKNLHSNSDLQFNWRIGLASWSDNAFVYGDGYFSHNNYYGYTFSSKVNKIREYNPRESQSNLRNMNENLSGLGYKNDWVNIQISRDKENWGAGNDIELALSEHSDAYDYFLITSDYGNLNVSYVYGFLENVEANNNRYITARGIEWTNNKSLIIGFSETVIYSGDNRSFDVGYINPMSSHLEVELNNRLNIVGNSNSNAVWQIHADCFFHKKFRLSANYLLDELVFDKRIQLGKENGKAYSARVAYTPILSNNNILSLYSSIIYVGTPTFRHKMGTNNFVQNGKPLGWYRGSDSQEIKIGLNYFNRENLIINISSGLFESGEENIIDRTYETYSDYQKGPFPSGDISENLFFDIKINYWWKPHFSLLSGIEFSNNNDGNLLRFKIGFQVFHQLSKT